MKILLVNPRSSRSIWSLDRVPEFFGGRALMPNPALGMLAALTPPGADVSYALCDEDVEPVDWGTPCDLVAVTGMTADAARVEEICRGFRSRGVPVALGGPFATLEAERCRSLADHHFIGEAEQTWPAFLESLAQGNPRATYAQTDFVDLTRSPPPDWSLWSPEDYVQVGVQTSRGCPHRCDFCDVIQYVGTRYRMKSNRQVMAEVREAHRIGFRGITLSDDNFVGSMQRARLLLQELAQWNSSQEQPVTFSTQCTMQVADHEDVLGLMAAARFRFLFLGLETLREEGLRQVNKTQNLSRDPAQRLARIIKFGLVPFLGIIVGFDADDQEVFGELEQFISESASPIVASSLLNAPPGTPLHERLAREGRLDEAAFSGEWQMASNMIYKNFQGEALLKENLDFLARVYAPAAFGERLTSWVERVEHFPEGGGDLQDQSAQIMAWIGQRMEFARANFTPAAFRMFRTCLKGTLKRQPRLLPVVIDILGQYWHFHSFVRRMQQT